jgi:hypothetical protein
METVIKFVSIPTEGNSRCYPYNHIEGKITQIWLANDEGIFFLIQGKITSTWLAETQARVSPFK